MVEQLKRIVGKVEVRTLTVLSVLVLLVVIGWSYAQLTGASNTVGSYDDLVNRYLDYRERSYMLCVPSWYLLADQVEAIDSQYGLAGFQDQPDWYVNFNMGELAIEPDSSLAALVADGTRLIL